MTGPVEAMKTESEKPNWSDLPKDIIVSIINCLHYADQIRFRAVCRTWREAANNNTVKYADKLPWIMACDSSSCFLFDPYHKRRYTVYRGDRSTQIVATKLLDSKYGWVLFSNMSMSSVFFYNPFTDKIIQLPKLLIPNLGHVATFSTTPVSSDCMVFVFRSASPDKCSLSDEFCISICKFGDTKWTDFFISEHYGEYIEDVEYVNGVFYCSFNRQGIGAFNAKLKTWDLLPYPESPKGFIARNHLTNWNGDLFLLQYVFDHLQWRVLRCDVSKWKWFQVQSLENKSIFVSHASMCLPAEESKSTANRIHPSSPPSSPVPQEYDWFRYLQHQDGCPEIFQPSRAQISKLLYHDNANHFNGLTCWIQPPQPRDKTCTHPIHVQPTNQSVSYQLYWSVVPRIYSRRLSPQFKWVDLFST